MEEGTTVDSVDAMCSVRSSLRQTGSKYISFPDHINMAGVVTNMSTARRNIMAKL